MSSNGQTPTAQPQAAEAPAIGIGINPVQGGIQLTLVQSHIRVQVIVPDSHIAALLENIEKARKNQPRVIL